MTLLDANSRVQVVKTPLELPGTCILCNIAGPCEDREFVDFGMQIEFYGAIYFCTFCIAPVAEAAGFTSSVEIETIKGLSEGYNKEVDRLKEENRILKDALVALLSNSGSPTKSADGSILPVEVLSELATDRTGTPPAKPDTSKSSSSKESGSILDNSDDSDDIDFTA